MAILVDTSCWIDHFRHKKGDPELIAILNRETVFLHDFVFGALLLGGMGNNPAVKELLQFLPHATNASHSEAETLVNRYNLVSSGIGWVDTHLIASCLLDDLDLMTKDRKLQQVWKRISRR